MATIQIKDVLQKYPINIRPLSEENGCGFLVEIPDLKGCVADGDTIEEALHEVET